MLRSIEKWGNPIFLRIDSKAFNKAIIDLRAMIEPVVTGWIPWTWDQIYDHMTPDTSPGYPWKNWGYKDKEEVFRSYSRCPPIEESVWQVLLKQELLPLEKIKRGWCRTIVIPPAHIYFNQLKWFGDFNERLKDHYSIPRQHGMALGFTPFYGGLLRMASLFPRDWLVVESDLTENDSRQSEWLMRINAQLRIDTCGVDCYQEVEALYQQEINTLLLAANGQVFRKRKGQPSGSLNTTIGNTINQAFYTLYAFYRHCQKKGIVADAKTNLVFQVLGDDSITASPAHIGFTYESKKTILEEECGQLIKEGWDSIGLSGHTFLGWRFKADGYEFANMDKLLDGLYDPSAARYHAERLAAVALITHRNQPSYYNELQRAWREIGKMDGFTFNFFPSWTFLEDLHTGREGRLSPVHSLFERRVHQERIMAPKKKQLTKQNSTKAQRRAAAQRNQRNGNNMNSNPIRRAVVSPVYAPVSRSTQVRQVGPGKIMVSNNEPVIFTSHDMTVKSHQLGLHAAVAPMIATALLGVGSTAFPWLAKIAKNFVKGGFKELYFEYVPHCPTSTKGQVVLGLSQDPKDTAPNTSSEIQMMNRSVSVPAWQNVRLGATQLLSKGLKFIPNMKEYTNEKLHADTTDHNTRFEYDGKLFGSFSDDTDFDGQVIARYTAVLEQPSPGPAGGSSESDDTFTLDTTISGWTNPTINWPTIPSNEYVRWMGNIHPLAGFGGLRAIAEQILSVEVWSTDRNIDRVTKYTSWGNELQQEDMIYSGHSGAWYARVALPMEPGTRLAVTAKGAAAADTRFRVHCIHKDDHSVAPAIPGMVTGTSYHSSYASNAMFTSNGAQAWGAGTDAPVFYTEAEVTGATSDIRCVKKYSDTIGKVSHKTEMSVVLKADKDLTACYIYANGGSVNYDLVSWDGAAVFIAVWHCLSMPDGDDAALQAIRFRHGAGVAAVTSSVFFTEVSGHDQM
jgi:hypothetical protein